MKRFAVICTIASLMNVRNVLAALTPPTTLVGNPSMNSTGHFQFGSAVDVSKDGLFLAVGADLGGQVVLYERTVIVAESHYDGLDAAIYDEVWEPVFSLSGNPGETIGDRLSIVSVTDGALLAVRRYNDTLSGDVEVYRYNASFTNKSASIVGDAPINACNDSKGKSVRLVNTHANSTDSPFAGNITWLLAGCESLGLVEIFRLNNTIDAFQPFVTIQGKRQGTSFGWNTALILATNQGYLQVAIANPNHDSRRGSVETYHCNYQGVCSQQFQATLGGDTENTHFGFAMDMATSDGIPVLVVGSPQSNGNGVNQGSVRVYGWGHPNPNPTSFAGWEIIGEPINGTNNKDRLGRDVSISNNGLRFVASSMHYERQKGKFSLYEVDMSQGNVTHISDFTGAAEFSLFGYSVSLDGVGNTMAVGAPRTKTAKGRSVGSVSIFQITPALDYIIPHPERNISSVPSGAPSVLLSVSPSSALSMHPSYVPSLRPSVSQKPTVNTIFQLKDEPSGSPSSIPSDVPSFFPSNAPSVKNASNETFSLSPSAAPSSIDSEANTTSSLVSGGSRAQMHSWIYLKTTVIFGVSVHMIVLMMVA